MRIIKDQLNRELVISDDIQRIVSLVPSITELICDLGYEDKLVGCTKFCVHPNQLNQRIKNIGGTKKIKIQAVIDLQPDIVFANKEENTKEEIINLSKHVPVWISDVKNVNDAANLILSIGRLLVVENRAEVIAKQIGETYFPLPLNANRILYLIWQRPMMSIGNDTYIHHILEECGFENVLSRSERYPTINKEEIQKLNPDLIFLSSEPFPFKDKHITAFKQEFPNIKTVLVDGEFFSWYGSRHLHLKNYLDELGLLIQGVN